MLPPHLRDAAQDAGHAQVGPSPIPEIPEIPDVPDIPDAPDVPVPIPAVPFPIPNVPSPIPDVPNPIPDVPIPIPDVPGIFPGPTCGLCTRGPCWTCFPRPTSCALPGKPWSAGLASPASRRPSPAWVMEFRGHGMGDPDFLKDSAAIPHFCPVFAPFPGGFLFPFPQAVFGNTGWLGIVKNRKNNWEKWKKSEKLEKLEKWVGNSKRRKVLDDARVWLDPKYLDLGAP